MPERNLLTTKTTTSPTTDHGLARRRWSGGWQRDKDAHQRQAPVRAAAHLAVTTALRTGALVRPSECSTCHRSDVRVVGHHDDYARQLDVRWLCDSCHRKVHAAQKRAYRDARWAESDAIYAEEKRIEAIYAENARHWGTRPSQRDNEGEEVYA